jgi:hypothetical protein
MLVEFRRRSESFVNFYTKWLWTSLKKGLEGDKIMELLHHEMNPIIHAVYHSILFLPLLYFAYAFMEFLEHKAGEKFKNVLSEDRRTGPVAGAVVGLIPFCGFSDLGAGLYAGRVSSIGTLISLFIATSGEVLLLLAGYPNKITSIVFVILIKFCIAAVCGFIVDICFRSKEPDIHIHSICEKDHCECEHSNMWVSALRHVTPVFCFVLSFNILFGLLELMGLMEGLTVLIKGTPALGVIFSSIVGLIPGCAPVILLLNLFGSGVISSSALLAGLIVSTGTGYLVLYKTNTNWKQNLLITLFIFIIGIILGTVFELSGLFSVLGI